MKPERQAFRVEAVISSVLRWGVAVSLGFMATGSILAFCQGTDYGARGGSPADLRRLLSPALEFPRTWSSIAGGIVHGNGRAVIAAGLLILIATPIARVACSIAAFALERDRRYVLITAAVMVLLGISFWLGAAG